MQPFEHQLIWKYSVVFGTFFNDIVIQRGDASNPKMQKFKIPIEFAPREKFLGMTDLKPTDDKSNPHMPRMAYEITGMSFDATRKLDRKRIVNINSQTMLRGAPWNLNFKLYIMTKNLLDATKIVEQILFMFQPDLTVDVKLLKDFDHIERITTDYVGVSHQDDYQGDFEVMRRTVWEIDFVMKAWLYGPIDEAGNQIKKIDVSLHGSLEKDSSYEEIIIQPGTNARW